MSSDLIKIKKKYGEKMMHLCASLFPTILEHDGVLFNIISSLFAYSKYLYDDICDNNRVDEFREYILSLFNNNIRIKETDKTPFELMDEAGYILYECKNEDEVASFKKYYRQDESLCTFYSNRTKDHYVFFAVKKNVDDIKREDMTSPVREDIYGTSVISIQFKKGRVNFLSIKNRYNHTVNNPDATFSNNLENIIPGLTDSFQKMYDLNIFSTECDFELPGYCIGKNGKYYKYNYYIEEIYYCSNNTIISEDKVLEYEKEKYILADYFLIDLVNKTIKTFDIYLSDGFEVDEKIDKIIVNNMPYGKKVEVYGKDFYIIFDLDKYNRIITYCSNLKELDDRFLAYNKTLKSFKNNELEVVGYDFLPRNNVLEELEIPNIKKIGDGFLEQNTTVKQINFPLLHEVGSRFMLASHLEKVILPNLEIVGDSFAGYNSEIRDINMPKLRKVGDYFLNGNVKIESINFPFLEKVGSCFMSNNAGLFEVNLPMLKYIGSRFLAQNKGLYKLDLPNVLEIGQHFLINNSDIEIVRLPKVEIVGDNFMYYNEELNTLYAPCLAIVGKNFLDCNYSLVELDLAELECVGDNFLASNPSLKNVNLPKLIHHGNNFLTQYYLQNTEKKLVKKK